MYDYSNEAFESKYAEEAAAEEAEALWDAACSAHVDAYDRHLEYND